MNAFTAMVPLNNFFALEGGEASGKSTQLTLVAERLRAKGYTVLMTREPGGSPIGERIREVLLDPNLEGAILPFTSACLFAASRHQLVTEVVQPALARREIVFTDRSFVSILVYQYLEGVREEFLHELCVEAMGGIMPSMIFLLDIPVGEMFERLTAVTRYDRQPHAFHEQVRRRYLDLVEQCPARIKVVDGMHEKGWLAQYLASAIEDLIV